MDIFFFMPGAVAEEAKALRPALQDLPSNGGEGRASFAAVIEGLLPGSTAKEEGTEIDNPSTGAAGSGEAAFYRAVAEASLAFASMNAAPPVSSPETFEADSVPLPNDAPETAPIEPAPRSIPTELNPQTSDAGPNTTISAGDAGTNEDTVAGEDNGSGPVVPQACEAVSDDAVFSDAEAAPQGEMAFDFESPLHPGLMEMFMARVDSGGSYAGPCDSRVSLKTKAAPATTPHSGVVGLRLEETIKVTCGGEVCNIPVTGAPEAPVEVDSSAGDMQVPGADALMPGENQTADPGKSSKNNVAGLDATAVTGYQAGIRVFKNDAEKSGADPVAPPVKADDRAVGADLKPFTAPFDNVASSEENANPLMALFKNVPSSEEGFLRRSVAAQRGFTPAGTRLPEFPFSGMDKTSSEIGPIDTVLSLNGPDVLTAPFATEGPEPSDEGFTGSRNGNEDGPSAPSTEAALNNLSAPSDSGRSFSPRDVRPGAFGALSNEVFAKFEDGLRISLQSGGSVVRISLHPEDLGSLVIRLKVEKESVTAKITVDDTAVKEALEAGASRLKEAFSAKGLILERYSVEVAPNAPSGATNTGAWADGSGNRGRFDGLMGWEGQGTGKGYGEGGRGDGRQLKEKNGRGQKGGHGSPTEGVDMFA